MDVKPVSTVPSAAAAAGTAPVRARTPSADAVAQVLERVDILRPGPGGKMWVSLLGREQLAATDGELEPGRRLLLEVRTTADGLLLQKPAAGVLLESVAASILRNGGQTDVPPLLDQLLAEVESLDTPEGTRLREAVAKMGTANRSPAADHVRTAVEDGGVFYEAKLAKLAADPESRQGEWEGTRSDFKRVLLDLVRSAADAAAVLPVARAMLDRLEATQAANVLSTMRDGPLILAVPFPDPTGWKTVRIAIQHDSHPEDTSEPGGSFTFWTDATFSDLGEVWVEASQSPVGFRAVIYQSKAAAAAALKAELPVLEAELRDQIPGSVTLEVRSLSDLAPRQQRLAAAMKAGRSSLEPVLDVEA